MNDLAKDLSEILDTPVTVEFLKKATDKQINFLSWRKTRYQECVRMEGQVEDPDKADLWEEEKEEIIGVIKDVLNTLKSSQYKPFNYRPVEDLLSKDLK